MKIQINKVLIGEMRAWLEAAYPHEACGFIAGHDIDGLRIVDSVIPVENRSLENQRRRFVIDPLDYLRAERHAETKNKTLLGVFHSHPDHPAVPSEHDLASAQPFFSYVIATVNSGAIQDVRSYQLADKTFEEEEIIIQPNIRKS